MSPLQIACKNESPKVAKFLLENKASVSYRGALGKNALEIAIECRNQVIKTKLTTKHNFYKIFFFISTV